MSARRRARGCAAPWGRGLGIRSAVWLCWSGAMALLCGGCMSGPLIANPGRAAAPADDGGFFVDVKVYKELEDLARPIRSTAGAAAFRSDNTVERQFEVIDPTVIDSQWIPIGRDVRLEQVILKRLASFDSRGVRP